jgi:Bacteriophage HK97-gp10, putative tail-component
VAIAREELLKLIADLGKIPPDLKRELRPALKKAGQPVLAEMRSNASWSTRIPGATRISTSFGGARPGITFVVSSKTAPGARPIEHKGQQGNFRHPVHGDRNVWVAQRARPFFYRAVTDRTEDVINSLGDTVVEIAARHGFH